MGLQKEDENMTKIDDTSVPPEGKEKEENRKSSESAKPRVTVSSNKEPTFFIGGNNGVALVNDTLEGLGWRRITEKKDDNYKLKWCELKSAINYASFREADQLVNHIPNCNLLTNKLGLLNSLQEHDKLNTSLRRAKGAKVKLDFIPETYRLDDPKERETFQDKFKPGEIWICKPTGRNQGKGIFLVRDPEEIRKLVEDREAECRGRMNRPLNRVIQRYIMNPLLLDNKKFDIRCYMLVANTVPYLVLYHKGYIRLSIHEYDNNTDNLIAHLTNQFIQKKDPMYKEVKDETTWSMARFNDYINERVAPLNDLEPNWSETVLTSRIKQIMTYCFNAIKHKLQCKIGYFDLYGFDFMVDDQMQIYLIEVNVNPCLATNCGALKEVVPGVVQETIHIAVECFEKSRKGRALMPLDSLKNFEVLYNGSPKQTSGARVRRTNSISPSRSSGRQPMDASAANVTIQGVNANKRARSMSPVRRNFSLSPVKEVREPVGKERDSIHRQTRDYRQSKESVHKDRSKEESLEKSKTGLTLKRNIPKATSISPPKPISFTKGPTAQSAKDRMALVNSSSPYAVKLTSSQEQAIRLKMSHNAVSTQKRTKSKAKTTRIEEDTAPNRGS